MFKGTLYNPGTASGEAITLNVSESWKSGFKLANLLSEEDW